MVGAAQLDAEKGSNEAGPGRDGIIPGAAEKLILFWAGQMALTSGLDSHSFCGMMADVNQRGPARSYQVWQQPDSCRVLFLIRLPYDGVVPIQPWSLGKRTALV
jgi:hypothetical protein